MKITTAKFKPGAVSAFIILALIFISIAAVVYFVISKGGGKVPFAALAPSCTYNGPNSAYGGISQPSVSYQGFAQGEQIYVGEGLYGTPKQGIATTKNTLSEGTSVTFAFDGVLPDIPYVVAIATRYPAKIFKCGSIGGLKSPYTIDGFASGIPPINSNNEKLFDFILDPRSRGNISIWVADLHADLNVIGKSPTLANGENEWALTGRIKEGEYNVIVMDNNKWIASYDRKLKVLNRCDLNGSGGPDTGDVLPIIQRKSSSPNYTDSNGRSYRYLDINGDKTINGGDQAIVTAYSQGNKSQAILNYCY